MRNIVRYEWACEYVRYYPDDIEDIEDSDFSDKKADVWPPRWADHYPASVPRLCLIRYSGNEEEGEQERGYAYPGDTEFSSGQKIPAQYLRQLTPIV